MGVFLFFFEIKFFDPFIELEELPLGMNNKVGEKEVLYMQKVLPHNNNDEATPSILLTWLASKASPQV